MKYIKKTDKEYRRKENRVRFFYPNEWEEFIYSINQRWRPYYWFLFYTGMRYKEAKKVKVENIDLKNKYILITKPKGGRIQRYCHLSSSATKFIRQFIDISNLKDEDTLGFPTIQHMISLMKRECKKKGFKDWKDFSCHNIRKTHENYLYSLDKQAMKITIHMGHTFKTAQDHYMSSAFIKDKKQLDKIRQWFGDIFE